VVPESIQAQKKTIAAMFNLDMDKQYRKKANALESTHVVCNEEYAAEERLHRKARKLIEFTSKIKRQVANRQQLKDAYS
jgi:hypothetical protein